jgi:hypothetical protein
MKMHMVDKLLYEPCNYLLLLIYQFYKDILSMSPS